MKQVLELHRTGQVQESRYEQRRDPVRTPEDIPTMKALMARRKDNQCIHCHDVKVAELRHLQQLGRFTRDLVFTYPPPSAVGIQLDPDIQNQVRAVTPKSFADQAGVREGDIVLSAGGQRIMTFADFTRVLELTPSEGALPLELHRGDQAVNATLHLSGTWRRTADPSWRESLHVAGPNAGFWGHKLDREEREKLGLAPERMAVRVTFIWGDYTHQAGIKKDDVVVRFDGLDRDMTIPQLHAHLNLNRNYGETIPLTVRRGDKEHDILISLPKERPSGEL
jgi:S1-C subfamily serine protease